MMRPLDAAQQAGTVTAPHAGTDHRCRVAVRPGARYRLECFVKTNNLDSPEGPRVVVSDASSNWIAASEPVGSGSGDWKTLAVDFVAPQNAGSGSSAIVLSIKRKPRFSYDEPTSGVVWFDDFSIKEQ